MIPLIEFVKAIGGSLALIGVPLALVTYRRSVTTKRAEWLASLHEKFFESERYANVRRVLDYRSEPEYSALASAVTSEAHHQLTDELYRYLNFFELLAGLRRLKQISDKEIRELFDYDIALIRQHDFLVRMLRPQGFESLAELIERMTPLPSR